MAQQLYFSRDSEMALEIGTKRWTIPVLEGFSFSQATNVSEIGLNEMESTAGVSRRGRRAFNDSLSAAEFSFSTYVRPFISQGAGAPGAPGDKEAGGAALKHHAVEEALWALFGGPATYASDTFTDQFQASTAEARINLLSSNVSTLGPDNDAANIYFRIGKGSTAIVYKLAGVVLNEATINFDIDGIAQIDWSGMASKIESESSPGTPHTMPTIDINEAYAATTNFIRNRLTTLGIKLGTVSTPAITNEGTGYSSTPTVTIAAPAAGTQATGVAIMNTAGTGVKRIQLTNTGQGYVAGDTYTCTIGNANSGTDHATATIELNASQDPDEDATLELETNYGLTLTGGSITMSNNVTYTTPEELGIVNIPVGHVTGSRAISGSFTCYLADDDTNSTSSKDFFDDMASLTTATANKFDLTFAIGGIAGTPRLEIHCPQAHVDIPTHAVEDLISIETTFNALPSSLDSADDADLRYVGKAY